MNCTVKINVTFTQLVEFNESTYFTLQILDKRVKAAQ